MRKFARQRRRSRLCWPAMRALVVLNPGSGSLAKLGIDRGRERVQSGGNIDRALFAEVLAEEDAD